MTTETLDFPVLQAGDAANETKVGRKKKAQVDTSKASDFELTQAAAGGDMVAFEEIYQRHHRRVYSICLRMLQNAYEAEDLTQDVFIQLYRKIGSFRGDSAFTTWLHRLTVNQVLMHFRKRNVKFEKIPELRMTGILRRLGLVSVSFAAGSSACCRRIAFNGWNGISRS